MFHYNIRVAFRISFDQYIYSVQDNNVYFVNIETDCLNHRVACV